jgi:hypothetical protein
MGRKRGLDKWSKDQIINCAARVRGVVVLWGSAFKSLSTAMKDEQKRQS